jgi:RecB family exonuclease/sulfur carrier protein ThiS
MKRLLIYPTSRALRYAIKAQRDRDAFLPSLMRIDEFEQRAIIIPKKVMVDSLQRILLLREASDFEEFKRLKFDKELIRFFSRSDAFFKFFEELAGEGVGFDELVGADAYVEFDRHIEILETLQKRYRVLLNAKGLTDRAFIPNEYQLNRGFIESYDQFELYLEGYLSHYELSLISDIAQTKPFIIHIHTGKFNIKMVNRFEELGITLPLNYHISFDLHTKEIIHQEIRKSEIRAKVYRCEERLEQIPLALEAIDRLVSSGIEPQNIVLILPDEQMQEQFYIYDKANNFNFAMGFAYKHKNSYKRIDALYRYWQSHDTHYRDLLLSYGVKIDEFNISMSNKIDNIEFFEILDGWDLLDKNEESVVEQYHHFLRLFDSYSMPIPHWLYLWMQVVANISIDDVRGGKVTVMGVLESRGISYEGVVIVDVNEDIVPVTTSKDRFLNTAVRAYASLPTKSDREALQKYFYQRILEQAKSSIIYYASSDNRLPSKFLYELGLNDSTVAIAPLELLYGGNSKIIESKDPIVERFNATKYRWSATMLKSFIECKREFYYHYIKNLKSPQKDEINEGLILHEVLDRVFRGYDHSSSIEELKSLFDKNLGEYLGSIYKDDDIRYEYYRILWHKRLDEFFSKQIAHFRADWRVVASEYQLSGDIEGIEFVGKIDRLDQNGTNTLIIDYKTGSTKEANRTKNLEKLSDFQMSIYNKLLAQKGYTDIELGFIKLFEKGEYEPIKALEAKDELLLEHITLLKSYSTFVAKKCDNLQKCQYCNYRLNCERGEYL